MHFSSTVLLLATALTGAAALPSTHRHGHVHQRAPAKFLKAVRPATPTPTPEPEPTPTPAPAAVAAAAEPAPKPKGGKKAFCGGANTKRATLENIAYKGNTGTAADWGCNIMQVDCADLSLYDYGAEFSAKGSSDSYSCSAFNKIGPKGLIDGFWFSAHDFQMKPGDKVCLAFDADSQGGVACGAGSGGPPRTGNGQLAGTWLEFDYGSGANDGYGGAQSGADVSAIVSDVEGMKSSLISMSLDAPGKPGCSILDLGNPSRDHEVYRGGMEDYDGVGCKGYTKGIVHVTLGH